ncbi:MAG: ABC transporter permease, partial [Bacteroidota bacterium]
MHGPLKVLLEESIPEMEQVARVVRWSWGDAGANHIRKAGSTHTTYEEGFFYADPELLEILEVPMRYGSAASALAAPNTLVISVKMAARYFANENPVGQQVILNEDPNRTYTIGGVMEDFPENSHLKGDFILTLFGRKTGPGTSGWCCTNYHMYTRLTRNTDNWAVEEKTKFLWDTHIINRLRESGESGLEELMKYQTYYLQPVRNIYPNQEGVEDGLAHGSHELLWIFGCVALVILLQAGMNMVNLSTA